MVEHNGGARISGMARWSATAQSEREGDEVLSEN